MEKLKAVNEVIKQLIKFQKNYETFEITYDYNTIIDASL